MAVIGYFIKFLGGSWGGVLQVGFLAAAAVLLFTLLFSGNLRARLRVYLSKHFFSYRYDYREEWLRFTEGLATLGARRGRRRASSAPWRDRPVANPVACCTATPDGRWPRQRLWEMHRCRRRTLGNLPAWIDRSGWVIDLREWRESPDIYGDLTLPAWLRENESLWLVVPLLFQESKLEGLLFLARTDLKTAVNWEDRDLLKTAGRQAAALLAQQRASRALVEARQFDAFNRLSAYVIHDLKNILAQQSLMVSQRAEAPRQPGLHRRHDRHRGELGEAHAAPHGPDAQRPAHGGAGARRPRAPAGERDREPRRAAAPALPDRGGPRRGHRRPRAPGDGVRPHHPERPGGDARRRRGERAAGCVGCEAPWSRCATRARA
jgi:hypothetical protein